MKKKDEDRSPNDADDKGMAGHGPGSIHKLPRTIPHPNDARKHKGKY